jgi:hypothetical protein
MLLTVVFRILFLGFGLLAFVNGFWSLIKRRASKSWPQVPGKVVRSFVKVDKGEFTSYSPVIEYEYVLEGAKYLGTRFSFAEFSTSRRGAEKFIAQYPADGDVLVLVNPEKPGEAVLKSGNVFAGLFAMAVAMAVGLIFIIIGIMLDFHSTGSTGD